MKQYLLLMLLAGTVSAQAQQPQPVDAILDEFYHHPEHIMVTAHRAAHSKYPENSLAAVKEAIAQGIDIAEIDVRETKDNILVLMHDADIKRVTGHPGKVRDFTYEELQQFPLLYNGQPTTEKIPTFDALLKLTKGKIMVDVDFKEGRKEPAQQAIELIVANHMESQVLFFLYDHRYAPLLHDWNPAIPIMPRAHNVAEIQEIWQVGEKQGKFPAIHIDDSFYSDSLMQKITSNGSRIWTNALGKYDDMEEKAANSGFDQLRKDAKYANAIQTNYPEKLLAYLRKKGLHK